MTEIKKAPAHSVFSASAADRWTKCAGSIALTEALDGGVDRYSYAAAEGTALHELMEWCLLQDKDAVEFSTMRLPNAQGGLDDVEITDEQYAVVQDVVDRVRKIPGTLMVETKVNYASIIGVPDEEGFGTCDIIKIDGSVLHIADAKFGRRAVSTMSNLQMILYALGALIVSEMMGDDIHVVRMEILQPRVTMRTPVWEISAEELREWGKELMLCANEVQEAREVLAKIPSVKAIPVEWASKYLNPGDAQCQWCRAAGPACSALQAKADVPVKFFDDFEDLSDKKEVVAQAKVNVRMVSSEVLGEAMSNVGLLKIYIEAVEGETYRRLSTGGEVLGHKLVRGRAGNRYWTNADEAEASLSFLAPDVYKHEPKLKSPSQLAASVKKLSGELDDDVKVMVESILTTEVSRTEPKPTLAPQDDPRPSWSGVDIETEFEDLA